MLVEKEIKVPLPKEKYIKQIAPAFDSSIVVLEHDLLGMLSWLSTVAHFNSSGKILKRYQFHEPIQSFLLLNSKQLMLPLALSNVLVVINLQNQTQERVSFSFGYRQWMIKMFYFSESNLCCIKTIVQKKQIFNRFKVKLTYFANPKMQSKWLQYQVDISLMEQCFVSKGNNHSLILFKVGGNQKQKLRVFLHDVLMEADQLKSRVRVIQLPIFFPDHSIIRMWQMGKDQITLLSISPYKNKTICQINLLDNSVQQYQFPETKSYFWPIFLKQFIFLLSEGTTYLLNGQTFSVQLVSQLSDCSWTIQPYSVHDLDPELLIENSLKRDPIYGLNEELTVRLIRPYHQKDFYLQCLLHLNEDFDDDILLDNINLLCQN